MDNDLLTDHCCHFSDELCKRLADIGAEVRSGARAMVNLAINPMEAIADLWEAPQQFTNDIHQGRPRQARVEEQFSKLSVGVRIEVFSNTCQVWCTGQVK